jgi:hypothetical protein
MSGQYISSVFLAKATLSLQLVSPVWQLALVNIFLR